MMRPAAHYVDDDDADAGNNNHAGISCWRSRRARVLKTIHLATLLVGGEHARAELKTRRRTRIHSRRRRRRDHLCAADSLALFN